MANSFKILLKCLFLVIILTYSPLIQARESKFFSKFTHFATNTDSPLETQSTLSPIESPASSPILSPAPTPSKGDETEVLFDAPANHDETQLFDEGQTYRKGSQSGNYNNNRYSYELGSESHETANQKGNYNYNYNGNNGYELVSTSSSHENGYEPVSTSSSRETAANDEKNYNGYTPTFSYDTNSIGNGNQLFSYETENEKKNQRQGISDTRFMENGNEPVSTSSSREPAANEEKNYNGYTPTFSYDTNSIGNGNQLFSDETENEKKNQRQGISDTRFMENGNEPVSTSSSREPAANEEKNYNGYTPNFSYNTNSIGGGNELFSYEAENEKKNQRQGMSDTRFMENGKYYYDVQKENENNNYHANGYNYDHNNQVNYNGNSANEFNTMEFENQEVYEDNQEESLP